MERGDKVRVRVAGKPWTGWCYCTVMLVGTSKQGVSLALRIDRGMLELTDGFTGEMIPVLISKGASREILTNAELELYPATLFCYERP